MGFATRRSIDASADQFAGVQDTEMEPQRDCHADKENQPPVSLPSSQHGSLKAAPCYTMQGRSKRNAVEEGRKATRHAQELVSLLSTSVIEMGPDFSYWPIVTTEILKISNGILTAKARGHQLQPHLTDALEVNPDAPAGFSLMRLKCPLQKGRGRRNKVTQNARLAAESPEKDRKAEPFPSSQPVRSLPILAQAVQSQTAHQARIAKKAEEKFRGDRIDSSQRQPLDEISTQITEYSQVPSLQPPSLAIASIKMQRQAPSMDRHRREDACKEDDNTDDLVSCPPESGRFGRAVRRPARFE